MNMEDTFITMGAEYFTQHFLKEGWTKQLVFAVKVQTFAVMYIFAERNGEYAQYVISSNQREIKDYEMHYDTKEAMSKDANELVQILVAPRVKPVTGIKYIIGCGDKDGRFPFTGKKKEVA